MDIRGPSSLKPALKIMIMIEIAEPIKALRILTEIGIKWVLALEM